MKRHMIQADPAAKQSSTDDTPLIAENESGRFGQLRQSRYNNDNGKKCHKS
jgi:hypothetical protein